MDTPARHHRTRIVGGLIAVIGAWPLRAEAEAPMTMPALAVCDGPTEPDTNLALLPDPDQRLQELLTAFQQAFDAAVTDRILKAVGDATRMAGVAPKPRPPVDPFAVKAPASATTSPPLAALANPTFGSREGMAVSIRQRLAPSGAFNTDIGFSHATGVLDAGFNLAAQQSLVSPVPLAMRYDGRAMVNLGQTMQFGLAARGSLGTMSAPTLAGNQIAGPLLHINLIDRNLSLVSDLGYDFGLNPLSAASRTQFHAKLDLRLKL